AGAYTPGGWLIFIRQGTLTASRVDLARGELTGELVTVADPVDFNTAFNVGAFSISASGLIAYRAAGSSARQLLWFDRSGKALGAFGGPDKNELGFPAVSPDGRRIGVQRVVQGNMDVWLMEGDHASRFTFDSAGEGQPIWSPDGNQIIFNSNRRGFWDLYEKSSNGGGAEQAFVESSQTKIACDWSSDGKFVLYQSADAKTAYDLWILPLEKDA